MKAYYNDDNVISKTNYEGGGDCKEGPNTYTNSYAINVIVLMIMYVQQFLKKKKATRSTSRLILWL